MNEDSVFARNSDKMAGFRDNPPYTASYMLKGLISILSAVALGLSAGCGVHRIDIQQGNVVDEAMINQIHTGMSKRQVKFVLGTPLLEDPFHASRWDYVYMFAKEGKTQDERRLTLYFKDDTLTKIVMVPKNPKAWTKPTDIPDARTPSEPSESGDSDSD